MTTPERVNGRVQGKVVLVTGGCGGIGRAIVARLAAEGATVVVADLDAAAGEALAAGVGGRFVPLDVTNEAEWQTAISLVEREFGRLDALVNNAGINRSRGGEDPETILIDDMRLMFSVNVEGVALGCKHAIPLLARSGGGSIVNFSSIAAMLPCDFIAAYGASKSAVQHWTASVALHCARKGYGIRCNSVHPGSVLTPMMTELFDRMSANMNITPAMAEQGMLERIPMGHYQEPIDIANAVLFLVSDEARYITGQPLVVDGGMMLVN